MHLYSNEHAMLVVVCHASLMWEASQKQPFLTQANEFGVGQMYIALEMHNLYAGLAGCCLDGTVGFAAAIFDSQLQYKGRARHVRR